MSMDASKPTTFCAKMIRKEDSNEQSLQSIIYPV